MSYINFKNLPQTRTVITTNESVGTMFRQMWDGIKFCFNTDNWTSIEMADKNYLNAKRRYFDEMYVITPGVKSKLLKWLKEIPETVWLSHKDMDRMLGTMDTDRVTSGYYDKNGGRVSTYDYDQTREYSLQRRARINNSRNSITYATCTYPLENGDKSCLLFFTFDSDSIATCQVLIKNEFSNGNSRVGKYEVVRIPQFNSIPKNEYTR